MLQYKSENMALFAFILKEDKKMKKLLALVLALMLALGCAAAVAEEATPELRGLLVPMCEYNGGVCHEMFPCGRRK